MSGLCSQEGQLHRACWNAYKERKRTGARKDVPVVGLAHEERIPRNTTANRNPQSHGLLCTGSALGTQDKEENGYQPPLEWAKKPSKIF